jgi:neutral ceramidase
MQVVSPGAHSCVSILFASIAGYAVPEQKGAGIHQRLRSRAFVFVDTNPGSAGKRVVYVSIDLCMGFEMVKLGVIERLQKKFGPDLYSHANVLISGTHTHATPGGIGGTVLVDITTLGFIKENYEAAVEGIFQSIVRAHNNVQPATIKINVGQCDGCNINRSPSSYLLDPERGQYANDTDHAMTVLRIANAQTGAEIGMINWFAVHGTSLNNTNFLVSGDNKGQRHK